ncbi:hypothetical protein TRVA0_004S01816 [Trichomonascus vanleenenianus]|uniref:Whi2p n=1 Tax=Trichomonascus vanleenenianus TaxID=2268995 RepID=UPI003ECAC0E5
MSVAQESEPKSIITQVAPGDAEQGLLYDYEATDLRGNIRLDLRGHVFDIPKEELLRLPESILLSITNGLVASMGGVMVHNLLEIVDSGTVNFSPDCFQYTLDVFRESAASVEEEMPAVDLTRKQQEHQNEQEVYNPYWDIKAILKKRPAIIVLREDLDFYCIPMNPGPNTDIQAIKRACGDIIVSQREIFSGLRKGDEPGSAEQHLIDMLCSSGFSIDDKWGFRASEPYRTVVSSLSLTRLQNHRPEDDGEYENDEVEMPTPHKLLLFWKKPARKCWWDAMVLDNVPGADGPVRVHIRRVWTLELSVVGVR